MATAAPFPSRPPAKAAPEPSYAHALRKGWWVVALAVLASLGAAAAFTARQTPVYRASATVVVAPNTSVEGVADVLRTLETLERRSVIATFARIPSSPQMRAAVAQRLELPEGLRGIRIEGSVLPSTNILTIDVEGESAEQVAAIANAAADAMREEVRSLYRTFTTRRLSDAVVPPRPIRPDPRRNYVVAALLGLFVGVLAAMATAPRRTVPGL
jgi:succinoglycan biosynthesis transport protein ExoP